MYSNSNIKDKILSQTNYNAIFCKFLGRNELPKSGNIKSPFAQDEVPSFKVYPNGTFKCYTSGKQGDVFQLVADLNELDCKTQFIEVANIIAKKMNIEVATLAPLKKEVNNPTNDSILANPKTINNKISTGFSTRIKPKSGESTNPKSIPIATDEEKKKLFVSKRDFRDIDLEYWRNIGVGKDLLEKFNVNSISSYHFTGQKSVYIKKEAVAFAFELDGNYKLYVPEQKSIGVEKRVLPNFTTGFFGLKQLGSEKKESIIICEGEKDVIVATSRGFNSVTLGSASNNLSLESFKILQQSCKTLFICYDNDEPGKSGVERITKQHPTVVPLQLPNNPTIKGYDITDYFQEHSAADFQKIIDLKNTSDVVTENTDLTIFHKAENYISKNYDLRFDVIANEIEISPKGQNQWSELNEDHLYVEMQKKHLKISKGNLSAILLSEFVPKFNPIKSYFENLPKWDKKTDYVKIFLDYIELEPGEDREQFNYHFRKWCVRSVKCSTIEGYHNKQAFVLSDDAKGQNIGKTTYIRFLVPPALNKYYCENLPEDKDALKRLGQNFIINLDELATLSRTDINKLKSMFSADKIKTRLPYGKKDVVISRVANFIGSTNMSTFLVDESGSVRWLCFIVKRINFDYSSEFNIDNLWAQAYALSKDENFKEAMTPEDIKQNEIRNDKFQIYSPERELISKFFEIPSINETPEFLSATSILNHISLYTSGIRLNTGAIGRAMPKCGFIKAKHGGVYGYWLVKKPI